MGNSFFHFQEFSIFSQDKGLKVNSDACLLGAIADIENPKHCLDIGTGTGVIALFLAQRFPETFVTAIEIEAAVYEQAKENIEKSKFANRIKTVHADALLYSDEVKYDLIVCNPPYFKNHLEKIDSEKNRAIHNKTLDSFSLITRILDFLNAEGRFWLIYPPQEAEDFKKLAIENNLYPLKEIKVYNKPGKHYRSIVCFGKAKEMDIRFEELLLIGEDGQKTKDFRLLMSGFYLENTEMYKRSN